MIPDHEMIELIKGAAEEEQFYKMSIEEMVKIYNLGAKLIINHPYNDDLIKATEKFKEAIERKKKETQPAYQSGNVLSHPAGFWMRFWAWCFDSVALSVIFMIVDFFLRQAFGVKVIDLLVSLVSGGLTNGLGVMVFLTGFIILWAAAIIIYWLLSQVLGWMYYVLFETGATHGTPGKLLFGLQVLGRNESPISFGRSTGRHFLKLAAVAPFLLASLLTLVMALFSDRAVDSLKMTGPFAVFFLILSPLLFLIFFGMAGWTKKKRALHDLLSDSYVVRSKELSAQRMLGTILGVILFALVSLVIIPGVLKIQAKSDDMQSRVDQFAVFRPSAAESGRVVKSQTARPALPLPGVISSSKMQSCGLPGMPENADVYLVGIRRGTKELDEQLGDSGHITTEVEVIVDQTPKPAILVLTAYDPVVWKISYTPQANIAGVLVSGNHTQALLGIPKTIPHRVITHEQSAGCPGFYVSGENELSASQQKIMELVGKPVGHYYGESASNYFQIGGNPYNRPTNVVFSSDLKLENYPVYKSDIPAGDRGIDALQRQQKIRLATAYDLSKWSGDKGSKSRLQSELEAGRIFVVNEQITLPPGLFGAHRRDFIIPADVPKPKGPKSHCNFFYLKDGTFE